MIRLLLLLTCFALLSAGSADALRCGSRIISKGAYQPEVLYKCGEPDFVETFLLYNCVILDLYTHHSKKHSHQVPIHRRGGGYEVPPGHTLLGNPIQATDWTYNFGPNRFMRRLRFISDKLDEINTVGYGY